MTAYDRLRKLYETAGPLAIAAPSDVAALLDEHEKLREELDALRKQEPVGYLCDDGYMLPHSPGCKYSGKRLYAAPVPAQPAVPEGYTPVRTDVLLWLLGENGDFECPPAQYFRGKPAPYFWRKKLRESMLSASPAQPAVPEGVAMDAACWEQLVAMHKFNNNPAVGFAINRAKEKAAILSTTEGRKDE